MEISLCPVAFKTNSYVELLEYILQTHSTPTLLVVCSTRDSYLQSLQAEIQNVSPISTPMAQIESTTGVFHPLLHPTIHMLATTKSIHLAFMPTLSHLRAYLATYRPRQEMDSNSLEARKQNTRIPMLIILDFLKLHCSTSEYSAQGLSRTLAIAVEAARLSDKRLVLAELQSRAENQDLSAMHNVTVGSWQDPWEDQIPLLSGSIRFGDDSLARAGRTTKVERVMKRWCNFEILEAKIHKSEGILT